METFITNQIVAAVNVFMLSFMMSLSIRIFKSVVIVLFLLFLLLLLLLLLLVVVVANVHVIVDGVIAINVQVFIGGMIFIFFSILMLLLL